MSFRGSAIGRMLVLAVTAGTLGACQTTMMTEVRPTAEVYPFVAETSRLAAHTDELYDREKDEPNRIKAFLGSPDGYSMCFSEHSQSFPLNNTKRQTVAMRPGAYPFKLYRNPTGAKPDQVFTCSTLAETSQESFTGAMMVYNVDKAVELATFGLSDETALLKEDLLDEVRKGVLADYTISFDNKPRIVYWLGNRRDLYAGGIPTVELDFRSLGLRELKVDDKTVDDGIASVEAYELKEVDSKKGEPEMKRELLEHPLEFTLADGRSFRGYIRNLSASPVTAFMRLECDIPEKLFNDAQQGTIATYSVTFKDKPIAEIVFGYKG